MVYFYVNIVMADSILLRVDKQFVQHPKTITTLILGDSHSQFDIDPSGFGNSFNFASANGSPIHNYYKLKYVVDHGYQVQNVILPLDFHTFSSAYFDEPANSWYWKKYIDFNEFNSYFRDPVSAKLKNYFDRYVPYFGQREHFIHFLDPKKKDRKISDGFIPVFEHKDKAALQKSAQERVALHYQGKEIFSDVLLGYFKKTLALCQRADIQCVLVRFPVSESYFNLTKEFVNEGNFDTIVNKLLSDFKGVPVLDFRREFFGATEYFSDADHLNSEGALEFSKILNDKLKRTK